MMLLCLLGYAYITGLIIRYVCARWIFGMSAEDIFEAMEKDGAFFHINKKE